MIGLVPLRPQPQAWLWRSVLSPFAERYCEYLVDTGYAAGTVNRYVSGSSIAPVRVARNETTDIPNR